MPDRQAIRQEAGKFLSQEQINAVIGPNLKMGQP